MIPFFLYIRGFKDDDLDVNFLPYYFIIIPAIVIVFLAFCIGTDLLKVCIKTQIKRKNKRWKKLLLSLVTAALFALNATAREYKCTGGDVIMAGLKANPSVRGIPRSERIVTYKNYRPCKIEYIQKCGFTPQTMISCMANSSGDVLRYVIRINKETGKAYVNSSLMRSQKMFKNSIKHGVSIEVK